MANENGKMIGWYSVWRESAMLLRWLACGDLHDDNGRNGLVSLRWFAWAVSPDGVEKITPMSAAEVKAVGTSKSLISGRFAELGYLHGLGVWTPSGGAIRVSVYVPPAWPMILADDGTEQVVKVVWTPDADLAAVFMAQHRFRGRPCPGNDDGGAPVAA